MPLTALLAIFINSITFPMMFLFVKNSSKRRLLLKSSISTIWALLHPMGLTSLDTSRLVERQFQKVAEVLVGKMNQKTILLPMMFIFTFLKLDYCTRALG